jgi:hypothetical protein
MILNKCSMERGDNSFTSSSSNKVSRTTLWRYRKQMGILPDSVADIKANARQNAFLNIRNAVSLCSTLDAVFRTVIDELFFSSDDVSVLLNGWDKPKCVTTAEAKLILNDQNLSIAVTETALKRRVVVFNVTVSARGEVLCYVIKILDHNFTDYQSKPKVYRVSDKLFIMLCHTSTNDADIQRSLYKNCIIPDAIAYRGKIIRRALDGPLELDSAAFILQKDAINAAPIFIPAELELVNKRYQTLVLASDGAYV